MENEKHSTFPEIQSHPLSCLGGKDCSQSEAIQLADRMAKLAQEFLPHQPAHQLTAGLTATGARASQTQALHSSGPFWQQPEVIAEAQPETAPTA